MGGVGVLNVRRASVCKPEMRAWSMWSCIQVSSLSGFVCIFVYLLIGSRGKAAGATSFLLGADFPLTVLVLTHSLSLSHDSRQTLNQQLSNMDRRERDVLVLMLMLSFSVGKAPHH